MDTPQHVPPTMIEKGWKWYKFYLIVRNAAHLSIKLNWQNDFDLMQHLQESAGMTFLYIFWNSSGVIHDRLLEMSLMVIPVVYYHKLTQVANKILFPLRQDIKK